MARETRKNVLELVSTTLIEARCRFPTWEICHGDGKDVRTEKYLRKIPFLIRANHVVGFWKGLRSSQSSFAQSFLFYTEPAAELAGAIIMEREIDQLVQAIAIASDPSQISLHHQALAYLSTIQENTNETWRLALHLFVDQNPDGSRKYPSQARFFGLRILDEFLDNRWVCDFESEIF